MFLLKWLLANILSSWMHCYLVHSEEHLQNCNSGYDIADFVSQLNLQFCTFVEVGQGYCSVSCYFFSFFFFFFNNEDNFPVTMYANALR